MSRAIQTKEEVLRVFDEWGRNFAPANLVQNEKNASLLADHVLKNYGLVSISYLNQAVEALADKLEWIPQPKTLEERAAEFQAKELARVQREKAENMKPFDHHLKAKAERAKETERLIEEASERDLHSLIQGYTCNSHIAGQIDYVKTEAIQKQLRQIEVRVNGKRNAKLTLAKVREVFNQLP